MKNSVVAWVAALLILLELVLVLSSWVLSAMMTWPIHSLLSSEGIRWFLGNAHEMILSPVLVWILLSAIAYGLFVESGLGLHADGRREKVGLRTDGRRERMGRRVASIVLLIYVVIIISLVAVPHAILLSATGSLFPSPFSRALVPMIALGLIISSVAYGLTVRTLVSFSTIIAAAQKGLASAAPVLLIYILFIQFYESLCYVFF